ncbi:MAG: hypothetical protein ACPGN3_08675 [Opitutales bacterium]
MNFVRLIVFVSLLRFITSASGASPLVVENGDFELPGDTWTAGGGIPDGWKVSNHEIVYGNGLADGTHGSIGLNHRWFKSPGFLGGGRSLYLIDPEGAVVRNIADGQLSAGVLYRLSYGYFSYTGKDVSIEARLLVEGEVVASQRFAGGEIPHRQWQSRTLEYVADETSDGELLTIEFVLTGAGDLRLDGVRIVTITPEIAELDAIYSELVARVDGYPTQTLRDRQKKALMELSLERAQIAKNGFLIDRYRELLSDLGAFIEVPADNHSRGSLRDSILKPLITVEGNPYVEALYSWIEGKIESKDTFLALATETFNPLENRHDVRRMAADMNRLFWLSTHPQSKYNGDPEVLKRLFRRLHAYQQAHLLHGNSYRAVSNDFFAIGPMVEALYTTQTLYADLLLASDVQAWDQTMSRVKDFWMKVFKNQKEGPYRMGRYANRDLAVANILMTTGLYFNDDEAIEASHWLVEEQWDNLYPDGAFAYIGTQNEISRYHREDVQFLTTFYHLSGESRVLELLKATEWYAGLSTEPGNVSDLWTAPSWKHDWISAGYGGEAVVALSGNRLEREMLDRLIEREGAKPSPKNAMWYDGGIVAGEHPDNYAVYDRNIQGPRGRFGRFSYAASLRTPDDSEPGKSAIMGAMTLNENLDTERPLDAMWMGFMPGVALNRFSGNEGRESQRAYLASGGHSEVIMGRDWSAVFRDYDMHTFRSSKKGVVVPWQGLQLWVADRDRIFGLMEVAPNESSSASEIDLRSQVRFHNGYEKIGEDKWMFGNLNVSVLDHNFDTLRTVVSEKNKSPQLEIIYSSYPDKEEGNALRDMEAQTHYALVEVSHGLPESPASVFRFIRGDLRCLYVNTGSRVFVLVVNSGELPVEFTLGNRDPDSWMHYPANKSKDAHRMEGVGKIQLGPKESRILVSERFDSGVHVRAWPDFETLVESKSISVSKNL